MESSATENVEKQWHKLSMLPKEGRVVEKDSFSRFLNIPDVFFDEYYKNVVFK